MPCPTSPLFLLGKDLALKRSPGWSYGADPQSSDPLPDVLLDGAPEVRRELSPYNSR